MPPSALTLQHLTAYTCPRCGEPLGRFHAYPFFSPDQVISLTSDLGPMHKECAEEHAEDQITTGAACCEFGAPAPLRVVAIVKAAPRSPSARLTRLNPADPESLTLVLFSPETVHFQHLTFHAAEGTLRSFSVGRAATNEEVFRYMEPAIQDSMTTAKPGTDEHRELLLTLGRIQKLWIQPKRTPPSDSPSSN